MLGQMVGQGKLGDSGNRRKGQPAPADSEPKKSVLATIMAEEGVVSRYHPMVQEPSKDKAFVVPTASMTESIKYLHPAATRALPCCFQLLQCIFSVLQRKLRHHS